MRNENGLITVFSHHSAAKTVSKLIDIVKSKEMTVFAVIDHSSNAKEIGLSLRPSVLIIFGNPRAGTPLMMDSPTFAIDLPVKVLVWEDVNGKVWLTYNDPTWLTSRHQVSEASMTIINAIEAGMKIVTAEAASL